MVYITITNGELTKRNKYSQHTGYWDVSCTVLCAVKGSQNSLGCKWP